jgi:hypothetical protein
MITRRKLPKAGGLWLAGLTLGLRRFAWGIGEDEAIEIRMISNPSGTFVGFDPIGRDDPQKGPGRRTCYPQWESLKYLSTKTQKTRV